MHEYKLKTIIFDSFYPVVEADFNDALLFVK